MEKKYVIFLDVDGVLNNVDTRGEWDPYVKIDGELVARLAEIVQATNAEIYLVSDWKREWYRDKKSIQDTYADYLDYKLAEHGLKITDKVDGESYARGKNINEFFAAHEVRDYVILDDDEYDYYDFGHDNHYLPINPVYGLTDEDVQTAIDMLLGRDK